MIITSRIHAALPALGLGTPVIFVKSEDIDSGAIKGRLDGLLDLFNHQLMVTDKGLKPVTEDMVKALEDGPITQSTHLNNSDAYIPYRDRLIETTQFFVDSCSIGHKEVASSEF